MFKYSQIYPVYFLTAFTCLFIFMQGFTIPGYALLSVAAGSFWDFKIAYPLCLFCSTIGSVLSYILSNLVLNTLLIKWFPNKISNFVRKVESNKNNLFFYMLTMRVSPIIPNKLVNLFSPIAGIPLWIYTIGTLLGLSPLVFI